VPELVAGLVPGVAIAPYAGDLALEDALNRRIRDLALGDLVVVLIGDPSGQPVSQCRCLRGVRFLIQTRLSHLVSLRWRKRVAPCTEMDCSP